MKNYGISIIYSSLSQYEKYMLQIRRQEAELIYGIKFPDLEAYISHLAKEVIARQRRGEFVPRTPEEALAGRSL